MGAPSVTPQEIIKMQQLYRELGTYAAVGRAIGRGASTVAKYIQMKDVSNNIRIAVSNLIQKK